MIELTPDQQSAIAGHVLLPRQLIEIDMGGTYIRMSTGADVTVFGNNFQKGGLLVTNTRTGKAGVQSCRIQIMDADNILKGLSFSAGFTFRDVKYWKVYGNPPYDDDDLELIFKGEIIRIPSMGEVVSFDCMTKNTAQRKIPFALLGPPDIKNLPRPGQKLLIGNELFTVDFK